MFPALCKGLRKSKKEKARLEGVFGPFDRVLAFADKFFIVKRSIFNVDFVSKIVETHV